MIQADLDTLKTLYQTLKDDVQRSDDIQKLTYAYVAKADAKASAKEKEIMEI